MIRRAIVILPRFEANALASIQRIRAAYDPLAERIPPHLTLVFPFESALSTSKLADHLRRATAGLAPFALRLQGITDQDGAYLFLNVKRGNDALIELHDRLYTGPLAPFLRRDSTFTPHLTVGHLTDADADAFEAALAEVANMTKIFETRVEAITLYRIEPDEVRPIECIITLDG